MRSRYNSDPRWITARFASPCGKCKAPIVKGDRVFFYPASRTVYGSRCGCGEQASKDFNAAVADEDQFNAG